MYDFKLVSKIKTRIESIIGALQQRDLKLAFKMAFTQKDDFSGYKISKYGYIR